MNESRDIIENLRMVAPEDPWWWAKVLLVLALVAAAGAAIAWNLYRKGKLPFFQHPPVPPEQSALDRLAAIRHLIAEGRVRDFVREASDILRAYIEIRFGLRAPHLSTEEFLFEAEQSPQLDSKRRARLADFLFCCDKVKFALGALDVSQMESLYITAEEFIRQSTAPVRTGEEKL